jgi:hypothetical protein
MLFDGLFTGTIIKGQAQQYHFIQIPILSSFIVRLTLAYKTVKKVLPMSTALKQKQEKKNEQIRALFRHEIKQVLTSTMYTTIEISKFQAEHGVNIYQKCYSKSN